MKPEIMKVKEESFVFSCDWLGQSVRFEALPDHNTVMVPEGYQLKQLGGTNVWSSRLYLLNQYGNKVATILSDPKSSVIEHKAGLIELENEWLYHGIGVEGALDLVSSIFPFTATGLSRVDVCCDFVPSKFQYSIIDGLSRGEYYVQGKRSGSGFWSTSRNEKLAAAYRGEKIPHCQSWGHKTSSIKWKLYYKTKELLDAGGGSYMAKPYIVDIWRCAGMDISNVWRLEVSVRNGNQTYVGGEPITVESLQRGLFKFFRDMQLSRWVVRHNDGHKDKSNDRIVPLLNLDPRARRVSSRKYEDSESRDGRITLLRHLDNALSDSSVLCSEQMRENVLWHMQQIVEYDQLGQYFFTMRGCTIDDYVEAIRCKSYETQL